MSSSKKCTKCKKTEDGEEVLVWPCGICSDCDGDFGKHAIDENSKCPACLQLYRDSLPACKDCGEKTGEDYTTPCGACHACAAKGGKTAALAHNGECQKCQDAAAESEHYHGFHVCSKCGVVTHCRHCEMGCDPEYKCCSCCKEEYGAMRPRQKHEFDKGDAGHQGDAHSCPGCFLETFSHVFATPDPEWDAIDAKWVAEQKKKTSAAAKPKAKTGAAKPKATAAAAKPKTTADKPKAKTSAAKPKAKTSAAKPKAKTSAAKPKAETAEAPHATKLSGHKRKRADS